MSYCGYVSAIKTQYKVFLLGLLTMFMVSLMNFKVTSEEKGYNMHHSNASLHDRVMVVNNASQHNNTQQVMDTNVTKITNAANLRNNTRQVIDNNDQIINNPTRQYQFNGTYSYFQKKEQEENLLTIFTTFRPDPKKDQAHTNVLNNWSRLDRIQVNSILFETNVESALAKKARSCGWSVIKVPRLNPQGTPCLKEMYTTAQKHFKSVYYGYSNGDILYDDGLVNSLRTINSSLISTGSTALVIGKRSNVVFKNRIIHNTSDVARIGKAEGKLFYNNAQDFFFIARNKFPWHKVPDVVVGRRAYDNFMVGIALLEKYTVVDVTNTVVAMHQTGDDGNAAGHSGRNKDKEYNAKIIGRFNYGIGITDNAQYETVFNNATVNLVKRTKKTQFNR